MRVTPTDVLGVNVIEPNVFGDDRGFFFESWNARSFAEAGMAADFVQDNHSRSARHVLRGLHYQVQHPQGKLVRVVAGSAYDVVVDVRRSSATFGRWFGVELSGVNKRMLWIPPGLAHGFLALEDGTELVYKCTEFYYPQHERSLLWSDPQIGIEWGLAGAQPTLSVKDEAGLTLDEAELFA